MKILYPQADHIVMAFKQGNYTGCCDDGEHFAGDKMLKIILGKQRENTAIYVARKYNGRMGPRRFLAYQKVTEQALQKL